LLEGGILSGRLRRSVRHEIGAVES
jgi:hypothetical protein